MQINPTACLLVLGACASVLSVDVAARADDARDFGPGFLVKSADRGDFCLDASLDASQRGHEVYIFKCHGRGNQRWAITQNADQSISFVAFDGRCLDVIGARVGDRTPLQLYPCHLGPNQKFDRRGGLLVERQSGKCLTTWWGGDRNPIYIDECNGRREQRWATFRE
jgi:hypothetical protein